MVLSRKNIGTVQHRNETKELGEGAKNSSANERNAAFIAATSYFLICANNYSGKQRGAEPHRMAQPVFTPFAAIAIAYTALWNIALLIFNTRNKIIWRRCSHVNLVLVSHRKLDSTAAAGGPPETWFAWDIISAKDVVSWKHLMKMACIQTAKKPWLAQQQERCLAQQQQYRWRAADHVLLLLLLCCSCQGRLVCLG